jgi:hypothetical protein
MKIITTIQQCFVEFYGLKFIKLDYNPILSTNVIMSSLAMRDDFSTDFSTIEEMDPSIADGFRVIYDREVILKRNKQNFCTIAFFFDFNSFLTYIFLNILFIFLSSYLFLNPHPHPHFIFNVTSSFSRITFQRFLLNSDFKNLPKDHKRLVL